MNQGTEAQRQKAQRERNRKLKTSDIKVRWDIKSILLFSSLFRYFYFLFKLCAFVPLCLCAFFFIYPFSSYAGGDGKNTIRVAVEKSAEEVVIFSSGKMTILGGSRKIEVAPSEKVKFSVKKKGIAINGKPLKSKRLSIISTANNIFVNKRGYRGKLDILEDSYKKLLIINDIDIDDYLKGVLNNEISHEWEMEAIKAQAIIARTYAVYKKINSSNVRPYHLENTVVDQVYGGSLSERVRSNRAVEETSGMILTYNGKPALAVYHSVCGGHTEDNNSVWAGLSLPYLNGRRCTFDRIAPQYNWGAEFTLSDMKALLNKADIKTGKIKDIAPVSVSRTGRVLKVAVTSTNGEIIVTAGDLRRALGYNMMKSTLFDIKIEKDKAILRGNGSGHGVGLCQWGAKGMAMEGYSFENILDYYYEGTKIERF